MEEFEQSSYTPDEQININKEILEQLFQDFAASGFSLLHIPALTKKLDDLVLQVIKTKTLSATNIDALSKHRRKVMMLESFIGWLPEGCTLERQGLQERLKSQYESWREDQSTMALRTRNMIQRPLSKRQEQFLKGETGTTQNTESETMKITDKYNHLIGVLVNEKFLWLCNKADIGRICKYMEENRLVKETGTELARKAGQYFPEVAKDATAQKTTEKIRSAINNAAKEDRQASKIDPKSSAEAVLKYW
jgi:hypothetical protein